MSLRIYTSLIDLPQYTLNWCEAFSTYHRTYELCQTKSIYPSWTLEMPTKMKFLCQIATELLFKVPQPKSLDKLLAAIDPRFFSLYCRCLRSNKGPWSDLKIVKLVHYLEAKTVKQISGICRDQGRIDSYKQPLYFHVVVLDIAATGLNILAAWSPATARLNFNILSGTSMACSHITGVVALLKAVHPSWSPSAIKTGLNRFGFV